MFLSKNASRLRQREAEQARQNRMEIVKALSQDEISRRDLFRWGLLTTAGRDTVLPSPHFQVMPTLKALL